MDSTNNSINEEEMYSAGLRIITKTTLRFLLVFVTNVFKWLRLDMKEWITDFNSGFGIFLAPFLCIINLSAEEQMRETS
jgi:hypothetical protein